MVLAVQGNEPRDVLANIASVIGGGVCACSPTAGEPQRSITVPHLVLHSRYADETLGIRLGNILNVGKKLL